MTETHNTHEIRRKFEGDVLEWCEVCGQPKKINVTYYGVVDCACDCVKASRAKKEMEQAKAEKALQLERMQRSGFPDKELSKCTFEADDGDNPTLTMLGKKYVERFDEMFRDGKGLLLYGGVGGGKSFMAACIANELINQGKSCLMTNFARIANELSATFDGKQAYINRLNQFSLLIIDDLAAERDTEYMGEIVQEVIDARYRCGKPLIVTTNLTKAELNQPKSVRRERIISRLFEMCFPFEVAHQDRRRQALRQNTEKRIAMLGV